MGDDGEAKVETRGQMTQRHKREAMMLKKQAQKMGKKRKDEAKKLEQELQARHQEEVRSFEEREASASAGAAGDGQSQEGGTLAEEEPAGQPKGPTRAQKRREAKQAKEAEREARIALERAALGETPEEAETNKIEELLGGLNFVLHDIPPDGNCMFRSLEDQLSFQSTSALGFSHKPVDHCGLRKIASDHIRSHREDFEAFLEVPIDEYCDKMAENSEWGGHLELQAISTALDVCIEVYSAENPVLKIGEEKEGAPLRLSYHLHAYGLGEHYNSVRPIQT